MKKTEIIMGMPITVEVVDNIDDTEFEAIFTYFKAVDERYSTYKTTSEISQINHGLPENQWSSEMRLVLDLCEQTKRLTNGYFDINRNGNLDPSGLVKGWSINNAAKKLLDLGIVNFYIEAGGDIQVHGINASNKSWEVGIRNPFNIDEIIKVIKLHDEGVATSGTYIRGEHIYNPFDKNQKISRVKSLTVIGPNVYEADRYATAAFAMGETGITFIDSIPGLEGYMVDDHKLATFTKGFDRYTA
ncbi:MAG TPA: FAD:protein FMN transferase [Candidatus Dormibacteraeota bacterium]|nr:FAD:protein FMN transferase [Candidatus Dormibacteraeota bacterium]